MELATRCFDYDSLLPPLQDGWQRNRNHEWTSKHGVTEGRNWIPTIVVTDGTNEQTNERTGP